MLLNGRCVAPIRACILTVVVVLCTPNGVAASTQRPAQIETPLGCVETVVTASRAPTGPSMADGGVITFRNDIARGIREVYVPPGDTPIAEVGARVRVCLLSVPKRGNGCDPSKDIRGREFLVYNRSSDESSENAAVYTNAEHWCGGA